ncbi:MAG: hypothetical protein KGI50_05240 [Patescibacteria group bacterium]|nr:hypothetical protein [Patescibacteria group bacterium]MDE2438736.1 hypothetical protein [Patescibacteria group bacterium]
MSQYSKLSDNPSGKTTIDTLTPNSGGVVSPDASDNVNELGSGSITTIGDPSTHTITTQLTGLTQYDMLVGQGSTTIGLISPSATSGVPLISQGGAAYPIFGTAVVAGGGTGATSLTGVLTGNGTSAITANTVTQYGVLVAGASNVVSSIAPDASTSKLLASGGASANPSWLSYNAAASTSDIVSRDGNGVSGWANIALGQSLVTSAAGTTILTAASNHTQQLRGSTTQTFQLPDATTLTPGFIFEFNNNSTGNLTIVANDGVTTITTIVPGAYARVSVSTVSTTNGTWDYHFLMPSNAVYGTTGLNVTGTITGTSTVASGVAGSSIGGFLLSGNTSGTVSILPQAAAGTYNFNLPITAGTAGQLLTSKGGSSSAMTWTSFSLNIQVFTSSGTYTPTSGMIYCLIEALGGGGGGGGGASTDSTQVSVGGGGSTGTYAKALYTSSTIGASQSVTIGSGGTAGANTGGNGGSGGTTSVGSLVSCPGGGGGYGGAAGVNQYSAPGGLGSAPTITSAVSSYTFDGTYGETGWAISISGPVELGISGHGASSMYGGGGYSKTGASPGVSAQNNTGAGGSGCIQGFSNAGDIGGVGGSGIVIITEYIFS